MPRARPSKAAKAGAPDSEPSEPDQLDQPDQPHQPDTSGDAELAAALASLPRPTRRASMLLASVLSKPVLATSASTSSAVSMPASGPASGSASRSSKQTPKANAKSAAKPAAKPATTAHSDLGGVASSTKDGKAGGRSSKRKTDEPESGPKSSLPSASKRAKPAAKAGTDDASSSSREQPSQQPARSNKSRLSASGAGNTRSASSSAPATPSKPSAKAGRTDKADKADKADRADRADRADKAAGDKPRPRSRSKRAAAATPEPPSTPEPPPPTPPPPAPVFIPIIVHRPRNGPHPLDAAQHDPFLARTDLPPSAMWQTAYIYFFVDKFKHVFVSPNAAALPVFSPMDLEAAFEEPVRSDLLEQLAIVFCQNLVLGAAGFDAVPKNGGKNGGAATSGASGPAQRLALRTSREMPKDWVHWIRRCVDRHLAALDTVLETNPLQKSLGGRPRKDKGSGDAVLTDVAPDAPASDLSNGTGDGETDAAIYNTAIGANSASGGNAGKQGNDDDAEEDDDKADESFKVDAHGKDSDSDSDSDNGSDGSSSDHDDSANNADNTRNSTSTPNNAASAAPSHPTKSHHKHKPLDPTAFFALPTHIKIRLFASLVDWQLIECPSIHAAIDEAARARYFADAGTSSTADAEMEDAADLAELGAIGHWPARSLDIYATDTYPRLYSSHEPSGEWGVLSTTLDEMRGVVSQVHADKDDNGAESLHTHLVDIVLPAVEAAQTKRERAAKKKMAAAEMHALWQIEGAVRRSRRVVSYDERSTPGDDDDDGSHSGSVRSGQVEADTSGQRRGRSRGGLDGASNGVGGGQVFGRRTRNSLRSEVRDQGEDDGDVKMASVNGKGQGRLLPASRFFGTVADTTPPAAAAAAVAHDGDGGDSDDASTVATDDNGVADARQAHVDHKQLHAEVALAHDMEVVANGAPMMMVPSVASSGDVSAPGSGPSSDAF
ncbi:hypothetical protein BC831DRAFT_552385 [Entophlyctis helioformis]|nr:hypothetical protein BC831DRAFT_552385 [Entophlyctis helioformis]